jgi:hypothetical protein
VGPAPARRGRAGGLRADLKAFLLAGEAARDQFAGYLAAKLPEIRLVEYTFSNPNPVTRVYAGLVLLATQVFRFHSTVAVAASTLVAAALFHPVRRRVQRAVDRRFNRTRYDADRMVAAFAARLQDAVDLDSARDDLATVVYRALEPAHVSVWISLDS